MIYFDPVLAVAALSVTPLLFITAITIRKAQRRISKQWRSKISSVNNRFGEIIGAISITKSFGREKDNFDQFVKLNEETYQSAKKRGMIIFAMGPFSDFIRTLGLVVLLYVGYHQINNGVSVATVYLFILLQKFLFDPIGTIARAYSQFQSSFAALERILSIMADEETSEKTGGSLNLDSINGKLEIKKLSFQYEEDIPVLENVSFVANPGETIAIVGHTGAGKTTLASLIMGYYEVILGNIYFDDRSIDEYNLFNLRKNIGYVSQDVLLFEGTILENLLLVKPDASEKEIDNALNISQAKEFLESLPEGLDSKIQRGGKNLSKGQMQMISLARAILIDPKLLILDEFTSSLDLYTESKIQKGIQGTLKDRTSIVIAHRLTTILNADRIIVMEEGRLVEQGSHSELMSQGGPYSSIYNKYFSFQLAELKPLIKKH
jgi:ATP-binding cassette subfamily B protein